MITKILFTLAVIGVIVGLARFRGRTGAVGVTPAQRQPKTGWMRWAALAVVMVMILASVAFLYVYWRDANQVVQVQVIDSLSGRVSHYQVYRGDLHEREFETVDGRRVILANTERMEVGARP